MTSQNKKRQQRNHLGETKQDKAQERQGVTRSHKQKNDKNLPVSHLRIMLENAQEAIKVVQDKTIKFTNKKSTEIYGYSCEEMINMHMLDMIYPDDHEKVMLNHIKRLRGEFVPPYEYRIVDKKGNVKWIEVSAVICTWKDRPAIISFITDITTKVHAEEELKNSKRLLSDVINFLPEPTFTIDLHGKVIIWNKRMEEMVGIKSGDMIGKSDFEYSLPFTGARRPILIDLVNNPDKEIKKSYPVFKKHKSFLYAENEVFLKGEAHWLCETASPLYDHCGNIVGAIESFRDITDLKNVEKELNNKSRKLAEINTTLEETNTALRVLLKNREHDKNEMERTIVQNIRELVLPYVEKLHSTELTSLQKSLVDIAKAHLKEIVSSFLLKMESRHPDMTPRELQIASLIKDGYTTKDISRILHLEMTTINNHRQRIRNKMTLSGKRTNLRSRLMSLASVGENAR